MRDVAARSERQDGEVGGTKPAAFVERIVPHFQTYPLRSGKNDDFELFASVCEAMLLRRHLEPDGLREIVRWAGAMNPSGKRGYAPESILQSLDEMKA